MLRTKAVCLCLMMMAAISVYVVAVKKRQSFEAASRQLRGHFTEQQAIDRVAPLCGAILPTARNLYLTAEPQSGIGRDGISHHYWSVACGDSMNTFARLCVLCDADTGMIARLGLEADNTTSAVHPDQLTARTAVASAQNWMRRIDTTETWHLESPPQVHSTSWNVKLCSGRRRATLTINGIDGNLVFANVK